VSKLVPFILSVAEEPPAVALPYLVLCDALVTERGTGTHR